MAQDLTRLLREAWSQANVGDIVVRIHLFGIDHAEELEGADLKQLAATAGIPLTYATEIRKGIRLADHVRRK